MTDGNPNHLPMSLHAVSRCQQRGVRKGVVQAILEHHDIDEPVGGNCRVLRVSRKSLRSEKNVFTAHQSKQLEKLCIIWSDKTNCIVTVLHDFGSNRRYRGVA